MLLEYFVSRLEGQRLRLVPGCHAMPRVLWYVCTKRTSVNVVNLQLHPTYGSVPVTVGTSPVHLISSEYARGNHPGRQHAFAAPALSRTYVRFQDQDYGTITASPRHKLWHGMAWMIIGACNMAFCAACFFLLFFLRRGFCCLSVPRARSPCWIPYPSLSHASRSPAPACLRSTEPLVCWTAAAVARRTSSPV